MTDDRPTCATGLPLAIVLIGLVVGCKSTTEPPDPSAFKVFEDRAEADPRAIVFHNQSVEMVALEIFAPRETPKDCQAEAPHRLLCPDNYRHILDKRVYPRKKVVVEYPKELSMDCSQVWVRVHSRVMPAAEFREAIFLLGSKDRGLSLELGEGEAARLEQKDIGSKNQYPAPIRFCATGDDKLVAPARSRSKQEVAQVLAAAGEKLDACCGKAAPCRGVLRASLAVHRDGGVYNIDSVRSQGKVPEPCLVKALGELRFSGFTPKLTVAEVSLRLPRAP